MSELLLDTRLIKIDVRDRLVHVVVENRDDVEPAEGAGMGRRMAEVLNEQVLVAGSSYRGVLFDVRRGPEVFGPHTRNAIESMMRAAQRSGVPIVVIVANVTQRMQFDSMAGIYAPDVSRVVEDEAQAKAFLASRSR